MFTLRQRVLRVWYMVVIIQHTDKGIHKCMEWRTPPTVRCETGLQQNSNELTFELLKMYLTFNKKWVNCESKVIQQDTFCVLKILII